MSRKLTVLAGLLMAGMALPMSAGAALAQQDGQAVRDALGRAQAGAERRAVEDLINRLRGTPAPAAPAAAAGAPPAGAAPAGTAATPAAIPIPPATATPPATGAAVTPARPAVPPSGTAATPGATPVPASAPAATVAPGAPAVAARPGTQPAPVTATAPPPSVTLPRGGDAMAKAPEIAEKMDLPRADIEVYFGFNSAEITPEAMSTLTVMGQALADPQLAGQRFIIGGHTDGKGRPDFNLALSKRRSENVRKFIIEHYKIEPSRLIARGYGKSRLKNAAMPSADENRRVQIINWTRMVASAKPPR